jgi:ribosomal protein L11 methyltransferase
VAVFEFKAAIAAAAVPELEELLAEREEQRFMVIEDKATGRAWLNGYFPSRAEAEAAREIWEEIVVPEWRAADPEVKQLADKDWKESYKEHFQAWQFGPLHWVPVWQRETFKLPGGGQVLWLDPGMAFGTGNHETTRLCCERLVAFATSRQGQVPSGGIRALDAGCGSGILALSAAKLGFAPVAAFDNDPLAVEVSRANAELNGLTGKVEFFVGDLASGLESRQAELVMANIQADVLMRFAPELVTAVAPGGQLVLSGILERELAQVREAFAAAAPGWRVESRVMGEWSDLALARPA